jgi:hypothetical protein
MIGAIIIILLLTAAVTYLVFRSWDLAGKLTDAQEYIEQLEVTNEFMYGRIVDSYEKMREIDRLGAFEKDDEAGTTFQMLDQVITTLKTQFDGEEGEEE